MVKLSFLVEGQTEETFVKSVIKPHLQSLKFRPKDVIEIALVGGNGGDVSIQRLSEHLNILAEGCDYVTTLCDYYGFRGLLQNETKLSLEARILKSVDRHLRKKVIPYVQMYEFEGLLFSSPHFINAVMDKHGLITWADNILKECNGNPEGINNGINTAPSKRLRKFEYSKRNGPRIAKDIGLIRLRKKCHGFNKWLDRLEKL